jgi:hypothetical protein
MIYYYINFLILATMAYFIFFIQKDVTINKAQVNAILAKYDLKPVDPTIQLRKDHMLSSHDSELTRFR